MLFRLVCTFFTAIGIGVYGWLKVEKEFHAKSDGPLIVWSGERPTGKTWAQLGPKGSIQFVKNAGLIANSMGLEIKMDGEGFRGCGLNWKGWYPAEACDDATAYNALIFHIRQVTEEPTADLNIELVDNVVRPKGAPISHVLTILTDGGLKKIDGEWRKVVLPLEKFANNKPVKLDRLWGLNFSNTGNKKLTFQIDQIGFAMEKFPGPKFPESPSYKATAQLGEIKDGHAISEGIYGVCDLPREKLIEYGIAVTRWGGNTSTRYNWKIHADNGASDWYFKNRGHRITDLTQTAYLQNILANQKHGATLYQTIPMIGWVAKDHSSYSFPVAKYGKQQNTEPGHEDVGNGIKPDGTFLTADPKETSIPAPPEFIQEAVDLVVKHAGTAEKGGVKYWVLDNEPMLWNKTHRDVRPDALGYDELWKRTQAYALAIKKADPSAKVGGFCSWGWTDLFYSSADEGTDRYASQPDYHAHGKVPLAEWFIQQCGKYQQQSKSALVDVFDLHWYPQAEFKGRSPYNGKGMAKELNELRLRTTRDLWDPSYIQESWCRTTGDQQPTEILRRAKRWIEKHNPGMQLCLGEYNFGGADTITGALAQADVFGILAREQVDLAFIWNTPEGSQNLAWQLFRSYDGKSSRFGDWYIPAKSDSDQLAIYAAKRGKEGPLTIVLINKNLGGPCELHLELPNITGKVNLWRCDQESMKVLEVPEEVKPITKDLQLTLPAASMTLVVIE